jgi:hypothetical protein
MKKIIILIMASLMSIGLFAQSAGEGSFTTLHIKAKNPNQYTDFLKQNAKQIFKPTNPDAAGVCITTSGNNYPGEMFVWSAFASVEAAFEQSQGYDVYNVSPELEALREVVYNVTWKPIKGFELDPGYERVTRVRVSAANLAAYIEAGTKFEAAIQKAGHDFKLGIMQPLGGGSYETGTLLVRGISRTAKDVGKLVDEYFAGAKWAASYNAFIALQDEVVHDSYEQCEQIYTAR